MIPKTVRRAVFAAIVWACVAEVSAQPFAIGHVTVTFTDPTRDNREVVTEVFYPAVSNGDNTAIVADVAPFPVLAFGHGFVMGVDAYENIWSSAVPEGFIVALPTTEGGVLPSHANFGKDLAFVVEQLEAMGAANTSMFFGRISSQSAVMGHSMGGGAAFLAVQESDAIEALATLAPANTNPSAVDAAGTIALPSLTIAGANDCVTPPDQHQLPMYNALLSPCKTYVSIIGGSHCQMADSNLLCNLGELSCSPDAEISREAQHQTLEKYLVNWLKSTLYDDCEAGTEFDADIASDSAISFQKTCLQCEPLGVADHDRAKIRVFPNPFADDITVQLPSAGSYEFGLFDMQGREVLRVPVMHNSRIPTGKLQSGMYLYTIIGAGLKHSGKLLRN